MQAYNPVQPPPAAAPKKYDGKNGMPLYDSQHGGHFGASANIAGAGHAPPPETFSGHWANVSVYLKQRAQLTGMANMIGRYRKV